MSCVGGPLWRPHPVSSGFFQDINFFSAQNLTVFMLYAIFKETSLVDRTRHSSGLLKVQPI